MSLRNSILQIPPVSLSHLVGVCLEGCELDALLELDPPHSGVVLHVHGSLLKHVKCVMSNLWTINFSQEVFSCLLISGEKYYDWTKMIHINDIYELKQLRNICILSLEIKQTIFCRIRR